MGVGRSAEGGEVGEAAGAAAPGAVIEEPEVALDRALVPRVIADDSRSVVGTYPAIRECKGEGLQLVAGSRGVS